MADVQRSYVPAAGHDWSLPFYDPIVFHHLNGVEEKMQTLREIGRVLRPGGRLHLLDFAHDESGRTGGLTRRLHSHGRMTDNAESRVLTFMNDAGLAGAVTTRRAKMFFVFDIAYYQAAAA